MKKITIVILTLALFTGCVSTNQSSPPRVPVHTIDFEPDGRAWKVGYQARNFKEIIVEWVTPNETVKNWNELITVQIQFQKVPSLKSLALVIQGMLAKDCPTFETQIISEDESTIFLVWKHKGCQGNSAQREIQKIFQGTDGIYFLRYTVTEQAYSEEAYKKLLSIIKEAQLTLLK